MVVEVRVDEVLVVLLAGFRLLVVNGHAVVVESLPIGEQLGAMLALQEGTKEEVSS